MADRRSSSDLSAGPSVSVSRNILLQVQRTIFRFCIYQNNSGKCSGLNDQRPRNSKVYFRRLNSRKFTSKWKADISHDISIQK